MFADDDARETMLTMIFHTRVFAQILKCAAEFSLADHLSAGSRSQRERGGCGRPGRAGYAPASALLLGSWAQSSGGRWILPCDAPAGGTEE
jgi:hypothetical protein